MLSSSRATAGARSRCNAGSDKWDRVGPAQQAQGPAQAQSPAAGAPRGATERGVAWEGIGGGFFCDCVHVCCLEA